MIFGSKINRICKTSSQEFREQVFSFICTLKRASLAQPSMLLAQWMCLFVHMCMHTFVDARNSPVHLLNHSVPYVRDIFFHWIQTSLFKIDRLPIEHQDPLVWDHTAWGNRSPLCANILMGAGDPNSRPSDYTTIPLWPDTIVHLTSAFLKASMEQLSVNFWGERLCRRHRTCATSSLTCSASALEKKYVRSLPSFWNHRS